MPNILVVDDMAENGRLIRKALAVEPSYVVESVVSAEAALEFAAARMPDLVLMDLRLPGGMTGYEALLKLRALEGGQEVVVIAASASPTLRDEAKIRSAGFDGFLLKPLDVMALASQVAGYLSRGRAA